MKITYNKLVRDNIPDIIEADNKKCSVKTLDGEDYLRYLKEKLIEETKEVNASTNKEELSKEIADVFEVIEALLKYNNISIHEVNRIKDIKAKKNGKFDKRIFLEYVEE